MKTLILQMILWRPLSKIFVPIALIFSKKTYYDKVYKVWRRSMPKWAYFMETPDEHLPGAMYEPTVKKIHEKYGWFICSLYWLAWRNVGHGIKWRKGFEVPENAKEISNLELKKYGVEKRIKFFGPLIFKYGIQVYRDKFKVYAKNTGMWAVPQFTIRLRRNEPETLEE